MAPQITPEQIRKWLGSPLENVKEHWPLLQASMRHYGMDEIWPMIAALATIGVECSGFAPINEIGGDPYFIKMYWKNRDTRNRLGNLKMDDAVSYHGRGLIQLTGRHNYQKYGKLLNIPLLVHPELALEPKIACDLFAVYFSTHGVNVWAIRAGQAAAGSALREERWKQCRRLVNGGLTNYKRFAEIRDAACRDLGVR